MFATHQPQIEHYARESVAHYANTLLFVRLSVRRKLYDVKPLLDDVRQRGPEELRDNVSRTFYAALHRKKYHLYHLTYHERVTDRELMLELIRLLPGIGIVKAGFILQLTRGRVGCLDTHNLKRFGLNRRTFRADGTFAVVAGRVDLYLTLCESLGGAQWLWDTWCEYVAGLYPTMFHSAEDVSKYHVYAITGETEHGISWSPNPF